MVIRRVPTESGEPCAEDHRVFLHDVPWDDYERMAAIRGESAVPRMTYLEGEIELMSPSLQHEKLATLIGRLVEAYAEERGLDLDGYGSWTVNSKEAGRGAEADKCYVLSRREPQRPDLAIEVEWTTGGISKLAVWRGLGVPEVWLWRDGRLEVYLLERAEYVRAARSQLLPELDIELLVSFLDDPSQTQAVREYREALRRHSR
jgi:Uma2 family endonuclease